MTQTSWTKDPQIVDAINDAIALNSKGQTELAVQHLLPLIAKFPTAANIPFYVALFFYRSDRFAEAIEYVQQAILLSPRSEKASFVLFQSLWKSGQHIEALDEMKRLLAIRPSEEYSKMIKEWDLSEGDPPDIG
jgi:tetratricopeptide (TPR) repeat protein